MKNISILLLLTSTISLALSACSKDDSTTASSASSNDVLISAQQASITDLPVWLHTVGQVHSVTVPVLSAEVEGRITTVIADTGDPVEEGQLLAETDTSTLVLQQQAAQASLERLNVHISNAARRAERYQTLSSKNLSSQTQVDDANEQLAAYRADYKAAIAQLAIVEDSLSKSRIVTPVSGVIQQRYISVGDFVKRGEALFEITRPEHLQARLPFPETMALKVRIGQPVKIFSPLTPGEFVAAKITQLQPSIGPGSRAVVAIVDLEDPGNLRPKATLSARLLIETRQKAVMVPVISVVRRPIGEVVYVINGNKAEARLVEKGHHQDGLVEITAGLQGDETVAVEGAAFLTDGAKVKIAIPADASTAN